MEDANSAMHPSCRSSRAPEAHDVRLLRLELLRTHPPTQVVAQPGAPCVPHGLAACMSHDALALVTVVSRMHVVIATNAHAVAKSAEPITFSNRCLPLINVI